MKQIKKNKKKIALAIIAALILGCLAHPKIKSDGYLRNRVVRLFGNGMQCSGEQVRAPSGKDYILTAAHCLPIAEDGVMNVATEDGLNLKRKIIVEDPNSDLLLLEGLPDREGLGIAKDDHRFEQVRTFTHGRGFDTYKTSGVIIGDRQIQVPLKIMIEDKDVAACAAQPKYKVAEIFIFKACILDVQETFTTAMVQPGSSGGPVVDANGDLIGVVSVGGEGMSGLVRLQDIRNLMINY